MRPENRYLRSIAMPHEAHNGRVITSWLASVSSKEAQRHPGNERLQLTAVAMYELHAWYNKTEQCGRYLSEQDLYNSRKLLSDSRRKPPD